MTVTARALTDVGTSYSTLQSGDLFFVERAGAAGKTAYSELVSELAGENYTFTGTIDVSGATMTYGAITATTITAEEIELSRNQPRLRLTDTIGSTAGVEQTYFERGTDVFGISTANSSGTFVTNDYTMNIGASGATQHSFRIGGVEKLRIGGAEFVADEAYNQTTASAANVNVASNGKLARSTSTGQFKSERLAIKDAVSRAPNAYMSAGDIVDAIVPQSFKSDHPADEGKRFTGFIAEDVAAAYPEAAIDDDQNYDVRALVAVLWDEVRSLRNRVSALEAAR